MSFILWGIVVAIVVGIAGGLLFESPEVQSWLSIVAGALGVYGAWLLIEPDPSGLGEAQYATSRKLVRVALLVGVGGSVLDAMAESLPGSLPRALIVGIVVIAAAAGIFGVVGEFAKFIYLEKLAKRMPDGKLAARARVLRWGFGITLGVLAVLGSILTIIVALKGGIRAMGATPGAVFGALGGFMAVAAIAFIVFGVMTLFFYIRMRRALFEQHAMAQQAWGSAGGAE
jgi:hypothetical protein